MGLKTSFFFLAMISTGPKISPALYIIDSSSVYVEQRESLYHTRDDHVHADDERI